MTSKLINLDIDDDLIKSAKLRFIKTRLSEESQLIYLDGHLAEKDIDTCIVNAIVNEMLVEMITMGMEANKASDSTEEQENNNEKRS